MKKWICYLMLISMLLASCGKINKGYDSLEKGLIGILENREEKYVIKQLETSAKNGNTDVYSLAYLYLGYNGKDFFNKFLKKSKGNAEYYKAVIMNDLSEPEMEVINMFEESVNQGNSKAYYMLGNIYQEKLNFKKAQEYFEKGKNKGEIYSTYSYNYNKNFTKEYKRIEELNEKYKNNSITDNEKKELGTLILEKFSNYDKAYDILKGFISEEYTQAMYAKAKILEYENKDDESIKIYNDLFFKNKYYLAAFEIAYKLVNSNQDYELALKVLKDINSDDSLIKGYKGFVYEKLEMYDKAEENYLKSVKKNDTDVMAYLGKLYETKKEWKKAEEIYKKAYQLGSISAGYGLANVLEITKPLNKKDEIKSNKEAKKILERLSNNGDENSTIELSLYYKLEDKEVKRLNLSAATRFNPVSFYNLGVYYYNKKDKYKAKLFLRTAKEHGYELDKEYEIYINS
ncbi:MAG: SLEI family protein [Leptotrichiaceae bacterium]|nr:SLEI family protein [Leptotrichiaceae bacterium]MBP6280895.1 SLEI family protein [Leptotrichiaceae bacterium]MBP7100208.1 SLEI family protein [Leptotrichiaceae bacterium]MBP7739601.1 SLEI family protein [Leptotrichiaceae bacterium]MBP9630234.1 SLEI family protein [Leptotrichiaceae bacterium]